MKPTSIVKRASIAALAVFLLAGCATDGAAQHEQHHPAAISSKPQAGMMMEPGEAGCGMHEKMMVLPMEQRRAAMAEHMKTMSPQMMQQCMETMGMQMQMMREQMGAMKK